MYLSRRVLPRKANAAIFVKNYIALCIENKNIQVYIYLNPEKK